MGVDVEFPLPRPRAPNSQEKQHAGKQNHQKSNQKYQKQQTQRAGAKRPPLFVTVLIISDCFSNDFASWHAVFVVNFGPWALERIDLSQSGGSGARQPPRGLRSPQGPCPKRGWIVTTRFDCRQGKQISWTGPQTSLSGIFPQIAS